MFFSFQMLFFEKTINYCPIPVLVPELVQFEVHIQVHNWVHIQVHIQAHIQLHNQVHNQVHIQAQTQVHSRMRISHFLASKITRQWIEKELAVSRQGMNYLTISFMFFCN